MAGKSGKQRAIRSSFSLGGIVAENDHLLASAYFDNGDYETIESRQERRCFIVGRTGCGKSAAFAHLQEAQAGHVISIAPENLSLPYLTNLDVVRHLIDLDVHLESFFVALWKHVFLVEIIKHRYHIYSPEAKRNTLQQLRDRIARDPAKRRAVDYLEEFGDKFWCEADERVRQITESFVDKVGRVGDMGGNFGTVSGKLGQQSEQSHTHQTRTELATRYQQVVNETQLPRLNEMIVILNEEILDSPQHFTYLLIDDLDKEWVDQRLANLLIRCLFQAVVDLLRVQNLKILVALRTNIFEHLDYGSRSHGGQEEKFRGMVIPLKWSHNDLRYLLEQRVEAASAFYDVDPPMTLTGLLPNTNKSRGNPINYIINRTLMRPRDAILFMNACLRQATGKRSVSWDDIYRAETDYSTERLRALRDEWKNPYSDIDRLLDQFVGCPPSMSRQELRSILDDAITDLLCTDTFDGKAWLLDLSAPIWQPGSSPANWEQMYGRLAFLLYRIGFIGLKESQNARTKYSFEAEGASGDVAMIRAAFFDTHPAFRHALKTSWSEPLKANHDQSQRFSIGGRMTA